MSTIALHTTFIISETVRDSIDWFQRTHNRKWPMGYRVWCKAVRSAILATAWLLVLFFAVFAVPLCR